MGMYYSRAVLSSKYDRTEISLFSLLHWGNLGIKNIPDFRTPKGVFDSLLPQILYVSVKEKEDTD